MSKLYISGPPGSGKTSRLTSRLVELVSSGIRPDRILVLVPQQLQAQRFRFALAQSRGNTRGEPHITTIYGLAQQHVGLFFPLIAGRAGFADATRHPAREPVLINIEAAQYFLNQIVEPRMADFDDLKLYRPRLLSQILDSMNKAATSGFELSELAERLSSAWVGEPRRLESYRRMQEVAIDYRQFCLDHSLLDFSLLMDTFARHLLQSDSYHDYVAARYRHVLADNLEEGTPALHDFLALVLQTCDSAILVEDNPGGYRLFLGADPQSARTLRERCDEGVALTEPRFASPECATFGRALMDYFAAGTKDGRQTIDDRRQIGDQQPTTHNPQPIAALGDVPSSTKYWAGMVQWVVDHVIELVQSGTSANKIAVLAPFVEDVLRFELQERLQPGGIEVRAVRPSRPLYDHPVSRALATMARLAHPQWQQYVSASEMARALSVCIEGLDLVRAQVIADAALRISASYLPLLEDQGLWNRVGMQVRERYVVLQRWLSDISRVSSDERGATHNALRSTFHAPLDLFWQQLFTDVLSQPGFGLNADREAATVCDKLIRSARTFREVFEQADITPLTIPTAELSVLGLSPKPEQPTNLEIGLAYLNMLSQGMLAAQYVPERLRSEGSRGEGENAILLSPIYAYLTGDFHSGYQFWLDINSTGWHERIYQPLTHPYVLSRQWRPGQLWTDENEHNASRDMLGRVLGGLAFRCSGRIYLVSSQLNVAGQEESGMLARALQRVLVA